MKKTIILLLLTALCMTVLTSCDLGNGLVAELFENNQHQGDHGVELVPGGEEIGIDTDIMIDIDPPVEDIMTTPPYEIETWEDWTYDIAIDPVPDTDALFVINTIVITSAGVEETMTSTGDIFSEGFELHLRPDTVSVSFGGWAQLYGDAGGIGYRLGKNDLYLDSFWVELPEDAVLDESGAEGKGIMVTVPADRLEDGYNEVTLVYSKYGYVTKIGTIVVFKEVPTTEEETLTPAGQDTTMLPEIETEIAIETEIDTEIDIEE